MCSVHKEELAQRTVTAARISAAHQAELENAYKKACKRAASKKRPIPPRDEYYGSAWGYPYLMYGPYMAPIWWSAGISGGGLYYAGDYCSLPMGDGMVGNCVTGTCSPGIGAGACARAAACGGAHGGYGGTGGGCVAGGACGGGCRGGGIGDASGAFN